MRQFVVFIVYADKGCGIRDECVTMLQHIETT